MRIAIVNDMPMAVEVMRRVVNSTPEHEVVWVAYNGFEAVEQCAGDIPDLILMDLIMPQMDGVEATRRIMAATPCPILLVTASVEQNSAMVFEAMGAGALDAVNTPMLGISGEGEGRDVLLNKIRAIGILNNTATIRPAPMVSHVSPDSPSAKADTSGTLLTFGSSSGGPQALCSVLSQFPKDFSVPIVMVQHVDVQFVAGLADWLNEQCAITVRLAEDGDRPEAGTALLAGRNDHLVMQANGALAYTPEPVSMPYRPSVDVFWQSLATVWRGKVLAVLLTGMGRDGAQGMLKLRDKGAYTIAQDEESSAVYGMPKAAKELGAALKISALESIPTLVMSKLAKGMW